MVPPCAHVSKALSISANLGPEGLAKGIDDTLDKTMLPAKIEDYSLGFPYILRMGTNLSE